MGFKLFTVVALAGPALSQSLSTVLSNVTQLSILTTYLGLFPDLTQRLSSLQNITLLAPSNDAFATFLNSSAGAALAQNDSALLEAFCSYHMLNGTYTSISDTSFIPTALQPPQYTNVTGGQVVAAYASEDDDTISFTSGLLSVANVLTGDQPLQFSGGVIHIIDRVLTIPQNISETAIQANLTAAAGALSDADIVEMIDWAPEVTIFVPNNAAFEAVGSALTSLPADDLALILQYHAVRRFVGYSTSLENGMSLATLRGINLTITVHDDTVFVNDAKVVVPDILVANGVIHVIDNVLNPNNATVLPNPSADSGSPAFSGGAGAASNVPFTSGVPTPTTTIATESARGAKAAASSSSSSGGASVPMETGAVGAAALFFGGAAALVINM